MRKRRSQFPSTEVPTARPFLPLNRALPSLQRAVKGCRGCPLYAEGTQAVFGEGSARASVMLVGEQPGDQEDKQGKPFVGPSGRVLREAMAAAGLEKKDVYVTNAVKHFHWIARGTRRLHQSPKPIHIEACHPWLEAEAAQVKPKILMCLGATAARSVFGKVVTISKVRGELRPSDLCELTLVSVHPSSILRVPDPRARKAAFDALVKDLKKVVKTLRELERSKAA